MMGRYMQKEQIYILVDGQCTFMFFNLKSEYFSLVVIDAVIDMQVLSREHYVVSVATHCYCIP